MTDLFRRRGAFGRFRDLLADRGLLDEWRDYTADARKQAMLEWCDEEGIEVEGVPEPRLVVLRGGESEEAAGDEDLVVFETGSIRTSQAAGTGFPGYLIVEDRHDRTRLSDLASVERVDLVRRLS